MSDRRPSRLRCFVVSMLLYPKTINPLEPLANERTMPMKHCDRIYYNPCTGHVYIYKIFYDYHAAWEAHLKQLELFDKSVFERESLRDWLVAGGSDDVYVFKNRKEAFDFIDKDMKEESEALKEMKRLR